MRILKTKFKDLILIKTNIYKDKRGFLKETYQHKLLKHKLVFDIMSVSKKNVLRGLHIQKKKPQAKYITVSNGKILDVVVDLRKKSKTFGKYFSIIMSKESDFSLFVPEGFAHGFLCLSKTCTVNYKCSQYRDKNSEITLKWDDKKLNIKWPCKKPIISDKDKKGYTIDFFT